jgi:hypothetical protein
MLLRPFAGCSYQMHFVHAAAAETPPSKLVEVRAEVAPSASSPSPAERWLEPAVLAYNGNVSNGRSASGISNPSMFRESFGGEERIRVLLLPSGSASQRAESVCSQPSCSYSVKKRESSPPSMLAAIVAVF